jgi:CheY-like chemotaxis protein
MSDRVQSVGVSIGERKSDGDFSGLYLDNAWRLVPDIVFYHDSVRVPSTISCESCPAMRVFGSAPPPDESVSPMARTSCLAGIHRSNVAVILAALAVAEPLMRADFAVLGVTELRALEPALLFCDIDDLAVDGLELLRQIRFVLPVCIIAVYSKNVHRTWALACHLAGANGMFSKKSSIEELIAGVRETFKSGCFTDERFSADG